MLSWERAADLDSLWQVKDSCCVSGFAQKLSPATLPLKKWLLGWRTFFAHCNIADAMLDDDATEWADADSLNTYPVAATIRPNRETLTGTFTPAALRAALQPFMPLPVDVKVSDVA